MIDVLRTGTHRHHIEGAHRFSVSRTDGWLSVWWRNGTTGAYGPGQWRIVNLRRRTRDAP